MPRGKRTVYGMFCPDSGNRVGSVRLLKQNQKGVGWKDFKVQKYCSVCRVRKPMKLKEEKHSS